MLPKVSHNIGTYGYQTMHAIYIIRTCKLDYISAQSGKTNNNNSPNLETLRTEYNCDTTNGTAPYIYSL